MSRKKKIHGTCSFFGFGKKIKPNNFIVHSKGLGARGIAFKLEDDTTFTSFIRFLKNTVVHKLYSGVMHLVDGKGEHRKPIFKKDDGEAADNVYVKRFNLTIRDIFNKMREDSYVIPSDCNPDKQDYPTVFETGIYLLGEIYGKGVQDLTYGTTEPEFRLFDIYVGEPGKGRYLDYDEKVRVCTDYNIPMVPLIYRGPFSKDKILEWTDGKETVSGRKLHIREGVVIRPVKERNDSKLGRVMLKSVSTDYLFRKNATEFN